MFKIFVLWFFPDTYSIARNKAKISEITTDLSTTELSESTQNLYHTKNIKKIKKCMMRKCGVQLLMMI